MSSRLDGPPAPWRVPPGKYPRLRPPPIPPAVAAAGRRLRWRLADGRAVLELWQRRRRYRRELARLMRSGPHLIDDIGLLRAHAEREVAKPFWRP